MSLLDGADITNIDNTLLDYKCHLDICFEMAMNQRYGDASFFYREITSQYTRLYNL